MSLLKCDRDKDAVDFYRVGMRFKVSSARSRQGSLLVR